MSARRRERIADWTLLAAGPLLLVSLLLPWSHQISAALRARDGGGPVLSGVPASPTAWQVYSAVDVLLALLALGLIAAALRGGASARWVLAGCLAIALAFVVHALGTPPTNGVAFATGHNHVTTGIGAWVAAVALGLGLVAVLGSPR